MVQMPLYLGIHMLCIYCWEWRTVWIHFFLMFTEQPPMLTPCVTMAHLSKLSTELWVPWLPTGVLPPGQEAFQAHVALTHHGFWLPESFVTFMTLMVMEKIDPVLLHVPLEIWPICLPIVQWCGFWKGSHRHEGPSSSGLNRADTQRCDRHCWVMMAPSQFPHYKSLVFPFQMDSSLQAVKEKSHTGKN